LTQQLKSFKENEKRNQQALDKADDALSAAKEQLAKEQENAKIQKKVADEFKDKVK
jgi:hypothetical protein